MGDDERRSLPKGWCRTCAAEVDIDGRPISEDESEWSHMRRDVEVGMGHAAGCWGECGKHGCPVPEPYEVLVECGPASLSTSREAHDFLAASVAVWREVDRLEAEGDYPGIGQGTSVSSPHSSSAPNVSHTSPTVCPTAAHAEWRTDDPGDRSESTTSDGLPVAVAVAPTTERRGLVSADDLHVWRDKGERAQLVAKLIRSEHANRLLEAELHQRLVDEEAHLAGAPEVVALMAENIELRQTIARQNARLQRRTA